LLYVNVGIIQCLNDELRESGLFVLPIVAVILDLITDDLVEVTDYRVNLSLSCQVEALNDGREVHLHIVVKQELEVNRVQEGFGCGIQSEVVSDILGAYLWYSLIEDVLDIVGVLEVAQDAGGVDLAEPGHFGYVWPKVETLVCHDRLVAPLGLPEEFRAQRIAAVVLKEFVGKTLLSIVNLSDHALRTNKISHIAIGHVYPL
jgi:hypothetical protein